VSPLADQEKFILVNLRKLGDWLDLPLLTDIAEPLLQDRTLKGEIEALVAPVPMFRTKSWDGTARFGLYRLSQYAIVRALKAQVAIETGVLHGLSSAFLLQGLHDNDAGTLWSIDYPSTFEHGPSNADGFVDTLPPGLAPGWAIPRKLRSRWSISLGKSQDLLPAILTKQEGVDVFVHDSEHTWETMMAEFQLVWPRLRKGGVLIADNIDCNTSFFDFAREIGSIPYVAPVDPDHYTPGSSGIRFGAIRK
jgi:hypothetical protein